MPPPDWVDAGGSLAGNVISSSLDNCRSCRPLDFCFSLEVISSLDVMAPPERRALFFAVRSTTIARETGCAGIEICAN
jgi:hypothetical protein